MILQGGHAHRATRGRDEHVLEVGCDGLQPRLRVDAPQDVSDVIGVDVRLGGEQAQFVADLGQSEYARASGERRAPVTPNTFTRPPPICAAAVVESRNPTLTWPPSRSAISGPAPL